MPQLNSIPLNTLTLTYIRTIKGVEVTPGNVNSLIADKEVRQALKLEMYKLLYGGPSIFRGALPRKLH